MKPQACIQQVHTILGMCSTHATCCTIYLQHCEMIQCSTGSQVDHAYSRCTPSAFFISHLQHICHMLCNLMYNMAQCIICFQAWTILPPTHPPPPPQQISFAKICSQNMLFATFCRLLCKFVCLPFIFINYAWLFATCVYINSHVQYYTFLFTTQTCLLNFVYYTCSLCLNTYGTLLGAGLGI